MILRDFKRMILKMVSDVYVEIFLTGYLPIEIPYFYWVIIVEQTECFFYFDFLLLFVTYLLYNVI